MSDPGKSKDSRALVLRGGEPLIPVEVPNAGVASVSQSSNVALGDLAGGSIHKKVDVHGDIIITQPETALSRLYRDLREKAGDDEQLTEYIGQLQIFTRTVENEELAGLGEKLCAAGRQDQLDMAKAMKEMVYARLRENMFSRTFQTIYATLMGKIFEEFETYIKPAIARGADRAEIDELVHSRVVLPVVLELDQCPECSDAPAQTVRGMIYFLTGNCHIRWH